MDVGLLYAVVAFIGVIMTLLIINRTRATRFKDQIDRNFLILLWFFVAFELVDGVWGLFFSTKVFSGQFAAVGFAVITYGFHFMSALSAFVWAGYLAGYLKLKRRRKITLNILRGVLFCTQTVLLASNIRTGLVFSFPGLVYTTGPLRQVLFWLQFAYYLLMFGYVVLALLFRRADDKKIYTTSIVYSCIPVIGGILQLQFPDAPMYSLGFAVSAVAIYSFNITKQREEYLGRYYRTENNKLMAIAAGLAEDSELIVYIRSDDGDFDVFGESSFIRELEAGAEFSFYDFIDRIGPMILHPDDLEEAKKHLSREFFTGSMPELKTFSTVYRLKPNDEYRYYQVKIVQSDEDTDKDDRHVILGLFDADESVKKELEQQRNLQEALGKAESANRAKSQFLFNMSHDIRTPMNAILGFTAMAKKSLDDPEKAQDCLNKVSNAGDHLLSLINDILDMSRIENGKVVLNLQPMSLAACRDDIINIIQPLAKDKQIELRMLETVMPHSTVLGDKGQVTRVFLNILSNSVKYTNPGGTIECSGWENETETPGLRHYTFVVKDNGIGMSPEFLKTVFEQFSRERSSTLSGVQGTGLGMAITKNLVELMGGTVDIQSEVGVGTTVSVTLPFREADAIVEQKSAAADAGTSALRGKRALLAEDNELNREIATDLLTDIGLTVIPVENGKEAYDAYRKSVEENGAPKFDFILMDVQMPVMDGLVATKNIRSYELMVGLPRLPIVAMTANVFAEDVERSLAAGMDAHLGKPIETDQLVTTVAELLRKNSGGGTFLSSPLTLPELTT